MAGLWTVEILPSAERELHSLPGQAYAEAAQLIRDLAEDPFPLDAERLRGYRNRYKVRFYKGRYRFLYDVSEQQRKVIVGRIRIRDTETYSGMDRW